MDKSVDDLFIIVHDAKGPGSNPASDHEFNGRKQWQLNNLHMSGVGKPFICFSK